MIALDAKIDTSDINNLNTAIDLMIRNTTRLGKDAVHRASYAFLRSAKGQTPRSRKRLRTLQTANDAGTETWKKKGTKLVMVKANKPSRFYIVRRQGLSPIKILIPNPDLVKGRDAKRKAREVSTELKAKYKYKPNIGAGKNSWNRAFSDLGKSVTNTMSKRSQRLQAASRAKKLGGNFTPSIRITNDLSYLTKIAPDLERSALQAAGNSLLKQVLKGIEKQTRKF